MKKVVKSFMVLLLGLVFLGACSQGNDSGSTASETNTFTGDISGMDSQIAVTHEGETINMIEFSSSFNLADFGFSGADLTDDEKTSIEEMLASQFEQYNDMEGVTVTNEFTDDTFTVAIGLDMATVDTDTLNSLVGTSESGDASAVKYSEFVTQLEEGGFSE